MIMAAFLSATLLLLLFGIIATLRKPPLSQRQRSKVTPFPANSSDFGAELLMPLGGDAHCHPAEHPAHPSGADTSGHGSFDSGHAGFDAGHGSFDVGGAHH
jgi:hypothetical protein